MKSMRLSTERIRAGQGGPGRTFLMCRVQEGHFAIPVERVSEIVLPQRLTDLPEGRSHILGAFDHRGTIVPVVDFASAMGRAEPAAGKSKWVLLSEHEVLVGLRVSQVLDVVRISEQDLRTPPGDADGGQLTTGTVVMIRGLMAFIIATDRIMRLAYP
jgi:chemotaxis signal transduction protein